VRIVVFLIGILVPVSAALAAEDSILRKDGFLLIWESIRRPAFDTSYTTPFTDVSEEEEGFQEITYAKNRKFFDEETEFHPHDLLSQRDALLWIFRSRNVDERPDVEHEDLSRFLEKYPIATLDESMILSRSQLLEYMRALDALLAEEVHETSYYAADFHGKGTAFGETFNMEDLTAAHRSFPHNTLVRVTNVENGKSVVVRINDRGPYVDGRDMDLSKAAFERIASASQGVIRATYLRLGDKDLIDMCSDKPKRYQKRITRDVRFHRGIPHTMELGDSLYLGSSAYFVVRGIDFPDGNFMRIQDFVSPKERYRFMPSMVGEYTFFIGTTEGRLREMVMTVSSCNS